MDEETRFRASSQTTKRREAGDARRILQEAALRSRYGFDRS